MLEEGEKSRAVDVIEHPGSLAIAPLASSGRLLLVRQYRHAVGRSLWEIPAGRAEPGETLESGARRELREETGCTASEMEHLCSLHPTPGYASEIVHLFAASGLQSGAQQLDEDEQIEIREVSLNEALAMQASGEIVDMKTVVALLWLLRGRDK